MRYEELLFALCSLLFALCSLLLILFSNSCKKESDLKLPKETESVLMTDEECDDEVDGAINTAALGVVELAKDSSFRNIVHSKSAEQFDEDDNVLFKSLNELVPNLVETMRQSVLLHKDNVTLSSNLINYKTFKTFTSTSDLNSVVTGYPSCDGYVYTQIYIPFIDEVNLNSIPVIVIGWDEPDDCIVPGYQIQENGKVKIINVDEDYAQEHLVWVVSINERVDDNGNVYTDTLNSAEAQLGNGEDIEFRSNHKNVKAKEIKIDDKKECWLCGKAEVSFLALHAVNCQIQGNPFSGFCFIKIGNNDLGVWKTINYSEGLSYMALSPENPLTSPECIGFVLFEKDRKKRSWERSWTHATCQPGGNVTLYYHSKQTPYGGSGVAQHCYSSFSNNSSWTEYPVSFSWSDAEMKLEGRKVN